MANLEAPDFDDMMRLAERIGQLHARVSFLDIEIKARIGEVTKIVMNDPKYFLGGKSPSMEYVKSVYHPVGLENEIKRMKLELAEKEAELEESKLRFQVYRDMVTMFVTNSANVRASVA